MSAINSSAVLVEKGNIWIGTNTGNLVDFGAVRKVVFTAKQIQKSIESDNRGTIYNKARLEGMISCELLEPAAPSNLASLFASLVTKTTTAASSTPVTGEVLAASGAWAYSQPLYFAQQDGSQVVPTAITITGSVTGALTVNTQYVIVQDPGTKKWGVLIQSAVGNLAQNITANYTTTPAASVTLTGGTNLSMVSLYARIIGKLDTNNAKTRQIDLTDCRVTSDLVFPFVDVETANDSGVMPLNIESNKATTWIYTDQVNPN